MPSKKILYIAEDYLTSKVHHSLCAKLGEQGVPIMVFTVERDANKNRRLQEDLDTSNYQVATGKNDFSAFLYKYYFPYKIRTKYRLLTDKIDLNTVKATYAATLFSEGALAYQLYKKHGIPYVVAVRNTDIAFYLSKMPHLWKLGREILRHADSVVFITPSLRNRALRHRALSSIRTEITEKSEVIMNGIDPFWLENIRKPVTNANPFSLIYVGNFSDAKNLPRLIRACDRVRFKYPKLTLTLVGGGGNEESEVLNLVKLHPDWIILKGKTNDKPTLRDYYRAADIFVMPSDDTFGLVYVEALTQGLPILYGKERGFDEIYPENTIGCHADITDENDIAQKIEYLIANYPDLTKNIANLDFVEYDWTIIAKRLISKL
ncbi:glycosyltransferase family 4 protein [Bacteroidales bacterium OttesenSCG-928-B11]|nr:glycosyltransferase family 4 protein [Bacteroidales bacterium OttesenSCG-928-E04]MDL2308937.1 glycosyltransferase family 4 protein [Bacteroidales bacterium OttesenSCG-928-C03]MDL2312708.1 glycosyltransferase family 4 protein [Bacteroidales bacterium OttesenSCG-928-B11]MDL2326268.1 glycosyltransferase family 4 protein [Bacteroidales bacterium OttesenSCG-928-A14]